MSATTNMTAQELTKLRETYVPATYLSAHPIVAVSGEGPWVVDADGRRYIDFAGGIAVLNVGQRHPHVIAALQDQLGRLIHQGPVSINDKCILLAKRIAERIPGSGSNQVLFVNSGSEAVENAVKIARYATERPGIIAFDGAFHGRTMLTSTLTGKAAPYKKQPGAMAPEVYHTVYPYPYRPPKGVAAEELTEHCLEALRTLVAVRVCPEKVAAIIVEAIQGEGGYIVPTAGFLQGVEALCREIGALLVVDEVQTGYGRTGRFLASEWEDIKPDIIALGKSIAGGLPLAGVVASRSTFERVVPGDIGGTFAGNALACAAGLAVLDVFDSEPLLENATRIESAVRPALNEFASKHAQVGDVRGRGALLAFEVVKDKQSKQPDPDATAGLLAAARERGLIITRTGAYGNSVRLVVPLTIESAVLEEGVAVLIDAMSAALN